MVGSLTSIRSELLSIRAEHRGELACLMLEGELDSSTTLVLQRWLAETEADPNVKMVLDLEHLTFIDSSGLLALLRAAEGARVRGSSLSIINVRPSIYRLLAITGTTHLLEPMLQVDLDR